MDVAQFANLRFRCSSYIALTRPPSIHPEGSNPTDLDAGAGLGAGSAKVDGYSVCTMPYWDL